MNYLQKVKVILEHREYEENFLLLAARLAQKGIGMAICRDFEKCRVAKLAECGDAEESKVSADMSDCRDTEMHEIADLAEGKSDQEEENTLWITDSPVLARRLVAGGRAVLAYLHEHNEEKSFSGVRYACEEPRELEIAYLEGVYRRYRRLPLDILETKRLSLRETTEADVDEFYHIYADPAITQYMEGLYPEKEQEKAYIREYIDKIYSFYDFGVWTVVKQDMGEVIGRAGFAYREGFEEPELGFVIGVPWQRQGYAYEICSAILHYGWERLQFTKVRALVEPHNTPSLRLCEKLGMRREERLVNKGTEYLCMMALRP